MAIVIVMTSYTVVTFAWPYFSATTVRGNELVLERAQNVATIGALLLTIVGGSLCFGLLWREMEPPSLLVRGVLISVVLFAFTLLFLPAISVP